MIFTIKQNGKSIYKIKGEILPYSYFKYLTTLDINITDTKKSHELIEEILRESKAEWVEIDKEIWTNNFDLLPMTVINEYIDLITKISVDQSIFEIEQEKN